MRKLSDCCWITISVMSLISCFEPIPPSNFSPETPERLSLRIAANRTLKNSSKLLEKIPKNRSLSSNGTESSPASCNTRALNANQLFSRSMYLFSDTYDYFNSFGNNVLSVLPFFNACQSDVSNLSDTNPEVGTLSIKTSPNLLTKFVMASLCPKRITLS